MTVMAKLSVNIDQSGRSDREPRVILIAAPFAVPHVCVRICAHAPGPAPVSGLSPGSAGLIELYIDTVRKMAGPELEIAITMNEFKNATISRLANVYFDGQVTSRTVTLADGEKKTLGIMLPGTYRFSTDADELMEIQSGHVEVRLDGQDQWQSYQDNSSFAVPAGSAFDIRVNSVTDYCCSYGE